MRAVGGKTSQPLRNVLAAALCTAGSVALFVLAPIDTLHGSLGLVVMSLGLLQPLQSLALDADTLRTAIAASVAYCDEQGATSVADLVERASKLIAHP